MNQAKKILLVDDDNELRSLLVEQLQHDGEFTTAEATTAEEALKRLKSEHFDLVLLDVGLPDMDGRQACVEMRAGGLKAPVIMLTAADSENDTVRGLDAGANDYVVKPFRFRELLARLRAQLRQHEQSDD